jgi:aryl carrier-like protein
MSRANAIAYVSDDSHEGHLILENIVRPTAAELGLGCEVYFDVAQLPDEAPRLVVLHASTKDFLTRHLNPEGRQIVSILIAASFGKPPNAISVPIAEPVDAWFVQNARRQLSEDLTRAIAPDSGLRQYGLSEALLMELIGRLHARGGRIELAVADDITPEEIVTILSSLQLLHQSIAGQTLAAPVISIGSAEGMASRAH